jgi:hypothetical protein
MSDNNIVTLENLNEIDINLMNKTTTKGKLFKGPNWTAYNKENLGSIPQKIEKALIKDKKNTSKIGFSSTSKRFFQKKEKNPGPGSYNISKAMTHTSTSFHSNKEFGNSFISKSDRFNNSSLFYSKYTPGPGEYEKENIGSLAYNVSKSLRGKSLYNSKKNQSMKKRLLTPGPGHYNIDNDFKWNKFYKSSVFVSKVPRFKKKEDNKIPDPGKYYKDEYFVDIKDKYNNNDGKESFYFRKAKEKQVDLLKKYKIQTEQKPNDAKFKLQNKKGKIYNIHNDLFNPFTLNKQDIFIHKTKTFTKEIPKKEDNEDKNKYLMTSSGLSNNFIDNSMEYIHKILHKNKKPDIFKLNAPRWKKDDNEFKNPGPAYYHPKTQYKVLSFNRNNEDFIVSSGHLNEKGDNIFED